MGCTLAAGLLARTPSLAKWAARGLLVEGDGAISAGNLNLWGWGGIHHPAFALRGATVTTGGFGMGCNSGEAGTFEVSGGSFTCTGETVDAERGNDRSGR